MILFGKSRSLFVCSNKISIVMGFGCISHKIEHVIQSGYSCNEMSTNKIPFERRITHFVALALGLDPPNVIINFHQFGKRSEADDIYSAIARHCL